MTAHATVPVTDEATAIEMAALAALHRAATPEIRLRLGLAFRPIAGGMASIAATLPASAIVVNRALGFPGRLDTAGLAAVSATYRSAEVERFFVNGEADRAAADTAGFVPARAWAKFARPREAPLPDTARVNIVEVDAETATAAARIVTAAFDLGTGAVPWLACLAGAPGWHVFLALIEGQPAGTGALFIDGDIGWTDWGATDPQFRCRGVQRALLVHRLRLADTIGCARAYTCTGTAVPGEPQHSYANILRCGFEDITVRPNWAPRR
jgi:GNAT superfamily N-acetyltransferase